MISEDEIILMVKKKNKEAEGLLFFVFEKNLRFFAMKNAHYYAIAGMDQEDYYQEICLLFFQLLSQYDYRRSNYYRFFTTVIHHELLNRMLAQKKAGNDARKLCSLDDEQYAFLQDRSEQFSIDEIERHEQKQDAKLAFAHVMNYFNQEYARCLKLWAEGKSYQEIALLLQVKESKVNYMVYAAIKEIRYFFQIKK